VAAHDNNAAKLHYQQTVASSPGDVLARSDYALHLQHHHVQVVLRRLKARGTQVNVIARAAE
jgi:hypothetical protein